MPLTTADAVALGFLIRLTPDEGAPLLRLLHPGSRARILTELAGHDAAPDNAGMMFDEGPWGEQAAAALLDACPEIVKVETYSSLSEHHPELARLLRPHITMFIDIARLEPKDIQRLLQGADMKRLALGLYEAPDEVAGVIMDNLSEFNLKVVRDELGWLKEPDPGAPEEVREELVAIWRQLAFQKILPPPDA